MKIHVYGGHGHETKRTTYKDSEGNVFRGIGKKAKQHFQLLHNTKSIVFKISRKRK